MFFCFSRWHNHLNPEIKKTPWTPEEEKTIIECHKKLKNQWAKIAKYLPGRYAFVESIFFILNSSISDMIVI